jgi:lipopolysaccharide/colanic/teichoic acid biosynthesis glycosyltransferase
MEKIKAISRTLRLQVNRPSSEKLMVIVDEQCLDMLDEMMIPKKWGIQVDYILTDSATVRDLYPYHSRIYPLSANIRNILRYDVVDEIVCCTSTLSDEYLLHLTEICQQFGVSLLIQQTMMCCPIPITGIREIADYYFLALETNPRKRLAYTLKSLAEKAFAFFALLIMSPMLLIISLLINQTSPGGVIFKQMRVGLRGRKFFIYKFRTMVANAEDLKDSLKGLNETDGPAFKIKKDPRITSIGKILRKTGIDEIPQLYNVVRGEMSLIGPRPLLPDEVMAHEEWQLKRMSVKPGITCTWQIQPERNNVPFRDWMLLDREYVENWSIGYDIRIFFSTVKSFFLAKGA